ncbi:MAG: preprotein translocase subunit YajC [Bacteriovoracaceae bacterium]|nr:preprotein translocase subunit YajC [Bacteriovoracaceae bacterium]
MFDWIMNNAIAQDAAPAAANAAQPNGIMAFMPFVVIFIIFYFLMIRPQKKKLQEEQTMINALGKGDEVYTKSGILGTITGINETVVTLEVSEGSRIKVLRSSVGGKSAPLFEKKEEKKVEKKDK